jgi:hypothetical protein
MAGTYVPRSIRIGRLRFAQCWSNEGSHLYNAHAHARMYTHRHTRAHSCASSSHAHNGLHLDQQLVGAVQDAGKSGQRLRAIAGVQSLP